MFHPTVLQAYVYRRNECQSNPIDACIDTANYHGLSIARLAQFLVTVGIDSDRLSILA